MAITGEAEPQDAGVTLTFCGKSFVLLLQSADAKNTIDSTEQKTIAAVLYQLWKNIRGWISLKISLAPL